LQTYCLIGVLTSVSFSGIQAASSERQINHSPHRVLGDDNDGPHSSAIIIGSRTVLACAHSLGFVKEMVKESEVSIENTKRTSGAKKSRTISSPRFKYLEDYWIQSSFARDKQGNITTEGRIPIKLYKFNVTNDWALFERNDGRLFAENEIASIEILQTDARTLLRKSAEVIHCPVSLLTGISKAYEFSLGSQTSSVTIQTQSTHHVKYEGRDLCRGSSGGGVYHRGSGSVLGMHIEAITEGSFDADDDGVEKVIARTDKRVSSEDEPYKSFEPSVEQPIKKQKSDSETIASMAGGNKGLGSAIIICKFNRLMHYYLELERCL
jgi:hypothetical protein